MDAEAQNRLVAGWIEHHTVQYHWDKDCVLHKERGTDQFWAWEQLAEIVHKNPALGWNLILRILSDSTNESVLSNLAAGPLEDLIAWHGEEFIDQIEAQARCDRRFQELLFGVWPNATPRDIWARVEACLVRKV